MIIIGDDDDYGDHADDDKTTTRMTIAMTMIMTMVMRMAMATTTTTKMKMMRTMTKTMTITAPSHYLNQSGLIIHNTMCQLPKGKKYGFMGITEDVSMCTK